MFLSPALFSGSVLAALSPCYQVVLQALPANIPPVFREGAYRSAQHLTALDQGAQTTVAAPNLAPEVTRFARRLANSSFISQAETIRIFGGRFRDAPPYPGWVTQLRRCRSEGVLTHEEWQQAIMPLNAYFKRHARAEPQRYGLYHYFNANRGLPPPSDQDKIDNHKIYIERAELRKADKLLAALEALKQAHLHPKSAKFMPGGSQRFAMYWGHLTQDQLEKIREILEQHTLQYRGPGQDSLQFSSDKNGGVVETYASNDESVAGFFPTESPYDLQSFFRDWLRAFCPGGRLPSDKLRRILDERPINNL